MEDYNFWRDLFDTYQSLPPGLQLAWLIALAAVALSITLGTTRLLELILTRRRRRRRRRRREYKEPQTVDPPLAAWPSTATINTAAAAGLYRVAIDEHGVPYLETVGDVPRLDWDGGNDRRG